MRGSAAIVFFSFTEEGACWGHLWTMPAMRVWAARLILIVSLVMPSRSLPDAASDEPPQYFISLGSCGRSFQKQQYGNWVMTRLLSKQVGPASIVLSLDTKNESAASLAFGVVEPLDFYIQHLHVAYWNNSGIMLWSPALDRTGSKDISSFYKININGKALTTTKDNKDSGGAKTSTTAVYNLKGTLNKGVITRSLTPYKIEIKKNCKDSASCAKVPDPLTVFMSPTGHIVFSLMGEGEDLLVNGDVINHGKYDFWGKSGVHYHQGMKAGENTLNAICARLVIRTLAKDKGYDPASWLQEYVKFMTTPGSHNDTYAESFHRDFFRNWASGVPPERCSKGTEGYNTAQIGGFVMLPPVILANLKEGAAAAKARALRHLGTTHESSKLAGYAEVVHARTRGRGSWGGLDSQYSDLVYGLVAGDTDLRTATAALAQRQRVNLAELVPYDDIRIVHSTFGSACYIEDSFPSMLYLAYKYAGSFEKAVLANTNVGGENCHRGAALGAVMGAASGESGIPAHLITGLYAHDAIRAEIDAYVSALHPHLLGGGAAAAAATCAATPAGTTA
ncbi:hypothetical protein TSOC_003799 [Tetrabaena socialis]|uniref:ADP-ribosylglycohydrolase n=1 Tax=Tetrabaena socialis TaxID=47790 RepID=A0A2J8AAK9_9CHLO|nr:hypothetical protein TSOC_003799 [Tetrabaena socialis]|eukprot:PNH09558.1 hypothetical protein TSOC_003799 [Tetrabaena socialis]